MLGLTFIVVCAGWLLDSLVTVLLKKFSDSLGFEQEVGTALTMLKANL